MSTNLKGRLEIRLSPEDRDAVLKAAKRDGVNKSEWCRRVFANVLGTNATTPIPPSHDVGAGPSEYRRCVERGTHDERHGQCVECGRDYRDVSGANAAQVETGPSEAENAATKEQSGPASVPSSESEGVRPAVQSQNRCPGCGEEWPRCPGTCLDGTSDGARVEAERAAVRDRPLTAEQEEFVAATVAARKPLACDPLPIDAKAKPKRITNSTAQGLRFANAPRRADVGPKPEAARKPRPKTGKGKK